MGGQGTKLCCGDHAGGHFPALMPSAPSSAYTEGPWGCVWGSGAGPAQSQACGQEPQACSKFSHGHHCKTIARPQPGRPLPSVTVLAAGTKRHLEQDVRVGSTSPSVPGSPSVARAAPKGQDRTQCCPQGWGTLVAAGTGSTCWETPKPGLSVSAWHHSSQWLTVAHSGPNSGLSSTRETWNCWS